MTLARRTKMGLAVSAAVVVALLAGAYAFAVRAWEPSVVRPFGARDGGMTADAMEVSCYPVLVAREDLRIDDDEAVFAAQEVFRARTFLRWDGRALAGLVDSVDRALFPQGQTLGGHRITLSFYSDNDREPLARICYDPGSGVPGDGVYLERGGCIYTMDGDQSEAIAYLESLVPQAGRGRPRCP